MFSRSMGSGDWPCCSGRPHPTVPSATNSLPAASLRHPARAEAQACETVYHDSAYKILIKKINQNRDVS
jgi:hypothetical protein